MNMIQTVYAATQRLGKVTNPAIAQDFGEDVMGLENMITNFIGIATIIAGLILIAYLIMGAITWATAGGDPKAVDKAKKIITNAVTGMVLVAAAMIIIAILQSVLGIDILDTTWDSVFRF